MSANDVRRWGVPWVALIAITACVNSAWGQASHNGLRFYGTGVGPPGQQDRVRIQIDDDAPGPDASAPCDVGQGSFTIEWWMRGLLTDNDTNNDGGDNETNDIRWINGNIIVDRDIFGGSERKYGISIAGGFVQFGTSEGDDFVDPLPSTIEGNSTVLDGTWHHVACVRDAVSGRKHIYVDGALDYSGAPGVSTADISYPDDGASGQITPWGWYIVLAAEKHDAGASFPSYNGYMDELRIWDVALIEAEIQAIYNRVIPGNTPGLVAYYRFEEGSGTMAGDSSSAGSPDGELIAGVPGNGEWVSYAADPNNTAPVLPITGNPPTAQILTPPPGTSVRAGDMVSFSGTGTDIEDGNLPAAAFTWTVLQRHDAHSHVVAGPLVGGSAGRFVVPSSGHGIEASVFEIQLTVIDSDALVGSDTRDAAPVVAVLNLDTGPSGVPLILDGETIQTPRAYGSMPGFTHTVEAPNTASLGGGIYGFECWPDGAPRVRAYTTPEAGGGLTAYFSSIGGQVVVQSTIESNDRDGDSWPGDGGESLNNAFHLDAVCMGRDGAGPYQAGLEFALDLPQGAIILDAALSVTANDDENGSPVVDIRSYDADHAIAFTASHAHAMTDHQPVSTDVVTWQLPAFQAGQTYISPDLATLVQAVVSRQGWTAGNQFGLVLDGSPSIADSWRCFGNYISGTPAVLSVIYDSGNTSPADIDDDGDVDDLDVAVFVEVLIGLQQRCDLVGRSDLNGDGQDSGSDIQIFVEAYLGS